MSSSATVSARQYFGETDETVNKKVCKVLAEGLKPIICVGEKLSEKQMGITEEIVCLQTEGCPAWREPDTAG